VICVRVRIHTQKNSKNIFFVAPARKQHLRKQVLFLTKSTF